MAEDSSRATELLTDTNTGSQCCCRSVVSVSLSIATDVQPLSPSLDGSSAAELLIGTDTGTAGPLQPPPPPPPQSPPPQCLATLVQPLSLAVADDGSSATELPGDTDTQTASAAAAVSYLSLSIATNVQPLLPSVVAETSSSATELLTDTDAGSRRQRRCGGRGQLECN